VIFGPLAEMNWSMMPQLAPTNSFSARWQSRASAGRECLTPMSAGDTAVAVATSTAAELLNPEPRGTSPQRLRLSGGIL
jgi:hypothetical protein